MQFSNLKIRLLRARQLDPRGRLRSAKRIFRLNAAVFALVFGVGVTLGNETNRGTIEFLGTGYAVLTIVAAIRVLVLRRQLKRNALVQARFDFAG